MAGEKTMVIIKRKKLFWNIAEAYFCDEKVVSVPDTDVIRYIQSEHKHEGAQSFVTLHIKLQKDTKLLFSEMNRTTRYKINRVEKKEGIKHCILIAPEESDIEDFLRFYNVFAHAKGIPNCNRQKLYALRECGALVISYVVNKSDEILCYHAYVIDGQRARCLYSGSHFRLLSDKAYKNMINRANCYLHWRDILAFKEMGYLIYDIGGVCLDESKIEQYNIYLFKKGFGGSLVKEFNYWKPTSIWGNILCNLISLKKEKK